MSETIRVRDVNAELRKKLLKSQKPPIIKWKDSKFYRKHAFTPIINEIVDLAKGSPYTQVNLIGRSGAGKTTLGRTIMHCAHVDLKKHGLIYRPIELTLKDMMDIKNALPKNEPVIALFDDIAKLKAMVSKKQLELLSGDLYEIRHWTKRVIALMSYQDVKAIPPGIRDIAQYSLFTQIGGKRTYQTLMDQYGVSNIPQDVKWVARHASKIADFAKWKYTYSHAGQNKEIIYTLNKPFRIGVRLGTMGWKVFVFPKRDWLQPNCSICNSMQQGSKLTPLVDMETAYNDIKALGGGQNYTVNAIKTLGSLHGINYFSRRQARANKLILEYIESNNLDFRQVAEVFDIEEQPVNQRVHIMKEQRDILYKDDTNKYDSDISNSNGEKETGETPTEDKNIR